MVSKRGTAEFRPTCPPAWNPQVSATRSPRDRAPRKTPKYDEKPPRKKSRSRDRMPHATNGGRGRSACQPSTGANQQRHLANGKNSINRQRTVSMYRSEKATAGAPAASRERTSKCTAPISAYIYTKVSQTRSGLVVCPARETFWKQITRNRAHSKVFMLIKRKTKRN